MSRSAQSGEEGENETPSDDGVLVADKLPLTTDKNGAARLMLKDLPPLKRASELLAEVTFNDPNGEVQTAATRISLWPSAVVLGIKAGSWASNRGKVKFTALVLDTAGKPLKGQSVEVRGRLAQVISTRKRLVGGFYAYDNHTEVKDLGALCSGSTDDRGLAPEPTWMRGGSVPRRVLRSVRRLPGPFPAVVAPVSTSHRISLPTLDRYSSRSLPVFS